MNGRAQIQTRLVRASGLQSSGLFFAPIHNEALRSLILTPSPKHLSFAWQGAEDDADHLKAGFSHSCFCSLLHDKRQHMVPLLSPSHGHPYTDALQTGVSIERHLSRIFPAHPRSLARRFSRARRHSAFCFGLPPHHAKTACWGPRIYAALRVSAFRKSFVQRTQKRFSEPSEKDTPTALGSGAHSRRFAQECPEGNPGKSKQEKFQWHFMKTTSL